ncbi:hypothetical protein M446_3114 [Methylobacterium sp. 4-46]|uniref:DUF1796 family putative cysteine peptidase n=1 Tax=unclassified Methylobacterium TaxID=2615210 RepID=UPI000152D085|nr:MULTISPECIES: DUF1796 family putative cysteine peptidase [Methylobacterium]ACA17524.1 hypothetical protein M446_3114 [Methylobacterium sp. 4-46]WFT83204.1 DUF1796 family putative cysteine peptidase [Methylobacterium nodulans]
MYRRYVSLGQNCEVAFQFRRIFGTDSSSFFSWNVTSFEAAIRLIDDDFEGILEECNLERHADGRMVRDKGYDYLFHSPFATPEPRDDPDFAATLTRWRERTLHLVAKFREAYRAPWRTAYFYVTDQAACRSRAVRLRDALRARHEADNFVLVLLQDEGMREEPWGEPCLANHYLKRLAPWHDASDGHVSSYDRVFRAHPFDGAVAYAGY